MQILTFPLGQLQANCYILIENSACIIIDPADSADFILEEIQRRNLKVEGLLATHGHFDHIMAVGELQLSLETLYQSPLPLYIHNEDMFLVKRLKDTVKHFLGHSIPLIPIKRFSNLESGVLDLNNFKVEVIHNPGHTPGSCSFYLQTNSVVFTGDTLFKDAVGGYDHSYSDKNQLKESVHRLLQLDDGTEILPGHGESSTLVQDEKKNEVLFF